MTKKQEKDEKPFKLSEILAKLNDVRVPKYDYEYDYGDWQWEYRIAVAVWSNAEIFKEIFELLDKKIEYDTDDWLKILNEFISKLNLCEKDWDWDGVCYDYQVKLNIDHMILKLQYKQEKEE